SRSRGSGSRHRARYRRRPRAPHRRPPRPSALAERLAMTHLAETDSSSAPPLSQTARRNIIAVASGKGGVGKTWFAITLAHALAQAGRKTLLFDGDLGLANVDVQLGLQPHGDIAGVIAGATTLADAVTPFDGGASRNGFDMIAGRSGSDRLANLGPAKV